MTPPFSACMHTRPPFSPVRRSARKIVASSTMNTPGYAMNSLKLVIPSSRTMRSISPSPASSSSVTIMWKP